MSSDSHIKIDKIDGESVHKDHKGQIDVLNWSWGAQNTSSMHHGGGGGKGKSVPGDFSFVHAYDKASPNLAKACLTGEHIANAKLSVRKAGGKQEEFLTVEFKNIFITAIQPAGSANGEILESVSFSYENIKFEYKPQDEKGATGAGISVSWNTKTLEAA